MRARLFGELASAVAVFSLARVVFWTLLCALTRIIVLAFVPFVDGKLKEMLAYREKHSNYEIERPFFHQEYAQHAAERYTNIVRAISKTF